MPTAAQSVATATHHLYPRYRRVSCSHPSSAFAEAGELQQEDGPWSSESPPESPMLLPARARTAPPRALYSREFTPPAWPRTLLLDSAHHPLDESTIRPNTAAATHGFQPRWLPVAPYLPEAKKLLYHR